MQSKAHAGISIITELIWKIILGENKNDIASKNEKNILLFVNKSKIKYRNKQVTKALNHVEKYATFKEIPNNLKNIAT